MPQAVSTTPVLAENKLVIYPRERSNVWQCRYKVGNRWKRETIKETDRKQAEKKAWDLLGEAGFRLRNNLSAITRRFRDVAALAVKRVTSERPEVSLMGFSSSRIELLQRHLVGMKHTALKKTFLQSLMQWLQRIAHTSNPIG